MATWDDLIGLAPNDERAALVDDVVRKTGYMGPFFALIKTGDVELFLLRDDLTSTKLKSLQNKTTKSISVQASKADLIAETVDVKAVENGK